MTQSKKSKTVAVPEKDKKPKLVRDSFTIPKDEYAAFDLLKARAMAQGLAIKKSELLRAGLMALSGLSDARFKAALNAVPTLKTGRPSAQETPAVPPAQAEPAASAPTVPTVAAAPAAAQPAKAPAARKTRKVKPSSATQEPQQPAN